MEAGMLFGPGKQIMFKIINKYSKQVQPTQAAKYSPLQLRVTWAICVVCIVNVLDRIKKTH